MKLFDLGDYIAIEFTYGEHTNREIVRKNDIIKVWVELPDEEKLMIDTILSNGKDYTIKIQGSPQEVRLNFHHMRDFLNSK